MGLEKEVEVIEPQESNLHPVFENIIEDFKL